MIISRKNQVVVELEPSDLRALLTKRRPNNRLLTTDDIEGTGFEIYGVVVENEEEESEVSLSSIRIVFTRDDNDDS